jgi:hypothetical protein
MPSLTRIGPSVHLVKLADTRVLRSVASAAVPVGCFNGAEAPPTILRPFRGIET